MNADPSAHAHQPAGFEIRDDGVVICRGCWTRLGIEDLDLDPARLKIPGSGKVTLEGGDIRRMDMAGAWLLHRTRVDIGDTGREVGLHGFSDGHLALLELVAGTRLDEVPPPPAAPGPLATLGREVLGSGPDLLRFLAFVGESCVCMITSLSRPWRVRWREVLVDLQASGVNALGIIGLLSFLIGVVLGYQGAVQLRLYGANIYIVDLLGLSLLRELAPMMAAIIVAGRTGSAYTAQIGTMMVTEEVSALRTLGVRPMEMLVLPKMLSLIIALPLLTVFADIMGLLGGMTMANLQLGLSPEAFVARFGEAIPVRSLYIGIGKAPIFAAIIALVGCYQGFQVAGGAASVGRRTTVSVVQSIFLVILVDALFSIAFSWLGI